MTTRSPLATPRSASEYAHLIEELPVGIGLRPAGKRGVVDQRRLVAASCLDVAVEAVVAGVAERAGEPAAVDPGIGVENLVVRPEPVYVGRRGLPEFTWVSPPGLIGFVVVAAHGILPPSAGRSRDYPGRAAVGTARA
jgi:hypothetical protein